MKLSEATYDVIIGKLNSQYEVKKSIVGASVRFLNRKQSSGESIENYARNLNVLANECSYSSCCLDRQLRDAFVAGIRDTGILSSLLQECDKNNKIKFEEVVEKAKIVEQLKLDAQSIRGDYGENVSFNVKKRTGGRDKISDDYKCIRCATRGKHLAHECFAIKLTCKSCGKKGHIAKACISNKIKSVEQESNASDTFENEMSDDNMSTNKIGNVLRIPKNTHKPRQRHTWSKNEITGVEDNVNQYPVYTLTTPSQPKQIVSTGLSNQTYDKRSFNMRKHNNVKLRKHTGDILREYTSDNLKTYMCGENVRKHMGDDLDAYTCTEERCDCDSFLY